MIVFTDGLNDSSLFPRSGKMQSALKMQLAMCNGQCAKYDTFFKVFNKAFDARNGRVSSYLF